MGKQDCELELARGQGIRIWAWKVGCIRAFGVIERLLTELDALVADEDAGAAINLRTWS